MAFASAVACALALMIPQGRDQAQAVPAGLPSHFGFGVSACQGDTWMPQTGVAWDYRFQYLVGGVNTGHGWETWNGSGTFALNYAVESSQHGVIPMFPYYELLQSSGTCGSCAENQKDITNLNNAGLMLAYYQNFALLMKRLGPGTYDSIHGFGKPALINIEPDFSGGYAVQAVNNNAVCFGFCTGQGNDPSLLKAAVASSGFADVATYPNTYAGYTRALAHLRDLYAPNVVLGLEVSPWATGIDLGSDSRANLDAVGLGHQVGTFLSKAGGHDVLFNNPLDRDAGQYKVQFGQNRWWDRLNVTFPNFSRWESYLAAAGSADGGKSTLLWQVPASNQYYDTENNTNGHFQDNRAEYIFSHIPELIQAGIVGVMFAPGNSGSTSYTDTMKDGVTNPSSFCTTDGTSSGQICNTHVSTVADDDGGFIRVSAQAYYQHPVPLSGGAAATSTPTSTPTRTTTPTATATPKPSNTPVATKTATPRATATTPATGTPTARATATAPAPATATPAAPSFVTSAIAAPSSGPRGGTIGLTASVRSATAFTGLVDIEVFDAKGVKAFQQFWDAQAFTAGQTRTFGATWQVPLTAAPGTYTVTVGVFATGWTGLYNWNGNAAVVTET